MSRGQTIGGSSSCSGGSSQLDEAPSPARARLGTTGSSMQEGGALGAAPPLTISSMTRPSFIQAAADGEAVLPLGGKSGLPVEQLRGASEFSEAGIREEPAGGAAAGDAGADDLHTLFGSKSSLPALPQSPGARIKAGRPATASPGRAGGGVVQRRGSPAL